jgi:hypothetical protein
MEDLKTFLGFAYKNTVKKNVKNDLNRNAGMTRFRRFFFMGNAKLLKTYGFSLINLNLRDRLYIDLIGGGVCGIDAGAK